MGAVWAASILATVLGFGGAYPPALSWVPFSSWVSSRLSVAWWVLPGPFLNPQAVFSSTSRRVSVSVVGCPFRLGFRVFSRFVGPWGLVVWSHPSIDLQLPRCLLHRLLNQCRLVFVLLGFGFLSCPWSCLTLFLVLGFPRVLSPVWVALSRFHLDTGSNMAVFALCHSMELCREVGSTHL